MAWSLVREVTSPALPATAVTQNIALGANASSVAVGNLLVLDLATIGPTVSGTPTSTTATAGALGPWTLGINVAGGGTTQITAVYFAVVKGPLISTDTISVTFTATAQPVILVTEFSAGFTIGTATLDKSTSSGAFGSTAFNSGTTAALAGASDLIVGSVTFDDGTGTNTITPAVLSPAWQAPPTTAVKTGPGSMRHSFRWRDPAASTAVAFTGTVSGTGPDWGAAVVAVTATPASAAVPFSPLLRMLVQGGLQRAKALALLHPPVVVPDVATLLSDLDTATGSETSDVQATVPGADTGTGSETGTVNVTLSDSDSGTGTDTQVSIVSPVSGSDSATGTDTGSVSATVPGSDSSTGTDAGTVSATASSADSGTGSEAGTAAASVPAADSGTGTEGGVVTETGPGGEGGAGTEAGTVSATVPGADSGSGTDAGTVVDVTGGPTTLTGSDSGTGTDVGTVVDLTVVEPPPTGGGGGDYGDETAIYGEPMRVLSDSDFGGAVEVGIVRDLTPAPERPRLRVILPRPRPAPAQEVFRALSDGDGAVGHDAQAPALVTVAAADAGGGVDTGDMQDFSEGDAEEWQMLTLLGVV